MHKIKAYKIKDLAKLDNKHFQTIRQRIRAGKYVGVEIEEGKHTKTRYLDKTNSLLLKNGNATNQTLLP